MTLPFSTQTLDNFVVRGMITRGGNAGIVVWLHGISVDCHEYLGMYDDGDQAISEAGFTSVRFDFRGHGESDGEPSDFTVAGQLADIDAVLRYVWDGGPGIPRNAPTHLIATSFGAPSAIFAAEMYRDKIRSLSLLAPVLSYRRTFLQPETEWAATIFSGDAIAAFRKGDRLMLDENFEIGPQLFYEMHLIRPDSALNALRLPTLLIHGEEDSMVPHAVSVEAAVGRPHIQLLSIRGMDHGYNDASDETGQSPTSLRNKERIFAAIQKHIVNA